MKHLLAWVMVVATGFGAAGCARMSTKIVEKPRVDQELGGTGNQGYLMGKAPDTGPRKKTRQMLQTDIELKTKDEIWGRTSQAPAQTQTAQAAPALPPVQTLTPQEEWREPAAEQDWQEPAPSPARGKDWSGTSYTVQKGDTLQKIASKFYGSTKPWRKIYEANQASLKSPDSIYPGQKLVIPAREEVEAPSYQEPPAGETYK